MVFFKKQSIDQEFEVKFQLRMSIVVKLMKRKVVILGILIIKQIQLFEIIYFEYDIYIFQD